MEMPARIYSIVRALLIAAVCTALAVFIARMESQRPLKELERAGASIVNGRSGLPRTISFCNSDARDEHLRWISRFESVTSVNISRSQVTADGVALLARLPRLSSLDLSETPHGEGSLAVVSRFPALRTLQLRRCDWITDDTLGELSELDTLECLMMIGVPVTDRGLETLTQLKGLRQLGIDHCPEITDEGLRRIAQDLQLESVSVNGCPRITDAGVLNLAKMPSLRVLSAVGIPMGRGVLREITDTRPQLTINLNRFDFPDLQPLVDAGARIGLHDAFQVWWVEIDDRWHDPRIVSPYSLAGQPRFDFALSELESRPVEVSDDLPEALATVPEISLLYLKSIPVNASGLQAIGRLRRLESLILENVTLSDDDLRLLSACDSLKAIRLRRVPVTGAGVSALAALPNLRELALLTDDLSQTGVEAATSLPDLETLAIGDVSLVSAVGRIAQMPKLSKLAMVRAELSADDIRELSQAPRLRLLELMHASLSADALDALSEMSGLQTLVLQQCEFDRDALSRLRERRPDLQIYGAAGLSRSLRGPYLPEDHRLLGRVPQIVPAAPPAVH